MKIKKANNENLKESTEKKLPMDKDFSSSVVTQLLQDGWGEIGGLQDQISLLNQYKNSSKLTSILQKLLDAYLIFVGQLEGYLDDKNIVDFPDEKQLKEEINPKINENDQKANKIFQSVEKKEDNDEEKSAIITAEPEISSLNQTEIEDEINLPLDKAEEEPKNNFFVDFEDPKGDRPLTDADIYDENGQLKL